MFSSSLMNMLNNNTKALNDQVADASSEGGKYLDDGEHDVKVVGVDRIDIAKNRLVVKYENDSGASYNDYIFVEDKDKKTGEAKLNWKFAKMLGMLLPDPDAVTAFFRCMVEKGPEALDLFVGMRGRLVLKTTQGHSRAKKVGEKFEVYDVADGTVIGCGDTIDEAIGQAEDKGYKRAYPRAQAYIATHNFENISKFNKDVDLVGQAAKVSQAFAPVKVGVVKTQQAS